MQVEIDINVLYKDMFSKTLEQFNKSNRRIVAEFQYEHSNGTVKYIIEYATPQDLFQFAALFGTKMQETFFKGKS
jgi:hypothetical protein